MPDAGCVAIMGRRAAALIEAERAGDQPAEQGAGDEAQRVDQALGELAGSGIVYCLTVAEAERLARKEAAAARKTAARKS